jgi:NAD/NADP transhydrogenase beta subunit
MCKAMNRSFFNVILGGFGGEATVDDGAAKEQRPVNPIWRTMPPSSCRMPNW